MAGKLDSKVLLAGRQVFWQENLQRLFAKEGWDFYILTDDFEVPEEIFRIQNVPAVIYIMEEDTGSKEWVTRLSGMLDMSRRYQVKHFYLISKLRFPAEARGRENAETVELVERLAEAWRGSGEMKITVLRLPEVYGGGERPEEGLVADWLQAAQMGEARQGYRDLDERREFLYVDDAVYAVFRVVSREYSGESLDIVNGQPVSAAELLTAIRSLTGKEVKLVRGENLEDFGGPLPDSGKVREEIGWSHRYNLKEGLMNTYREMTFAAEEKQQAEKEIETREKFQIWKKKAIPYLENIAGALLMLLVAHLQEGTTVNPAIYFDLNFVYIGAMGILYGKSQSLLAMVFSSLILLKVLLAAGANAVALLYMPQHLLHFIAYLFVAVLSGYFADARKFERESAAWQASQAQERYDFLRSLYDESIIVKDRLYRQIVNTDDSIGRLYRIIRNLDSVATENIFTQAAYVTAQVMAVDDIAVYVLGKDGYYLRQKMRMGRLASLQPRSLKVAEHDYLKNLIAERHVYVNRELVKDTPDLAAPIVYQGQVIAVVQIFGLNFSQWSLYQQNLLSITMRLVSASMGRAYQYEAEAQDKRYYPDTRILRNEAFQEIIQELRERRKLQGDLPIGTLKVQRGELDFKRLDELCGRRIRNEDFIGELEGEVYILLPDADDSVCNMVQERLARDGVVTVRGETVV